MDNGITNQTELNDHLGVNCQIQQEVPSDNEPQNEIHPDHRNDPALVLDDGREPPSNTGNTYKLTNF